MKSRQSTNRAGLRQLGVACWVMTIGLFGISASESAIADAKQQAYTIGKKSVTTDELYQSNQASFYEIEKQKYELIERLAKEKYLDSYWEELAKGGSAEKARNDYFKKNAKVTEAEIKEALGRFKDHPRMKDLSDKEKRDQIVEYLTAVKSREAVDGIIDRALKEKKLVISYPKPSEPIYEVKVMDWDPIKYGPNAEDIKPMGCSGDSCAITVVEYSEFQCPFCARVLPAVGQLMEEYKGKVRWIVRDFPLAFHNRAKPAAVAARCARDQGKYWQMYNILFENQRALEDKDFKGYAKTIGLDQKKFDTCVTKPEKMALVDQSHATGEKLGVTGTPAFFINGRRLSGALPYEEFKRIFDEELKKGGKS